MISLNQRQFTKSMQELELKFFGTLKTGKGGETRKLEVPSNRMPIDKKRYQPDPEAQNLSTFSIIRNGVEYDVEIFDEEKNFKYSIVVTNRHDTSDKDWMKLTQITPFLDELKGYLKQKLQVYTKPDGRIDYLSLSNDNRIFNKRNKLRVTQSLSQVRDSVSASSVRDSSLSGPHHH